MVGIFLLYLLIKTIFFYNLLEVPLVQIEIFIRYVCLKCYNKYKKPWDGLRVTVKMSVNYHLYYINKTL